MQSDCLNFAALRSRQRPRPAGGIRFKVMSVVSLGCAASLLTGCTLIQIKKLQPVIAPPAACTPVEMAVSHLTISTFGYEYLSTIDSGTGRSLVIKKAKDFDEYERKIKERVDSSLPAELRDDRVVNAFREFLTYVSARAQFDAQVADGTLTDASTIQNQRTVIEKHAAAPDLKHPELKQFANNLFESQLKRGAADSVIEQPDSKVLGLNARPITINNSTKLDPAFVSYFKAYYNGTFYDRFGTAITKPQLPSTGNLVSNLSNFSVPDSEIVAAETVLLEFLIDTIDRTPVMGNTICPNPTTPATCQLSIGESVVASAIVTVGNGLTPSPAISITANPTSTPLGTSSTLTVTAMNATKAVTLTGSSSITTTGGTQVVTPTATTVYTATIAEVGGTASASAAVSVDGGVTPSISITAAPDSIKAGSSSALNVKATNAIKVTLIGSDGSTYPLPSPSGGMQVVKPTSTTTYTATAIYLPSTTYYPGNSANQPTALTTGMAEYVQIPSETDQDGKPSGACGITTQNVWLLQTLANGASDEASTVGGLVANTAGGLGVSLGVFGKISIGDNATLSDLVKAAASELALRSTLMVSYHTLRHAKFTPRTIESAGGTQ